MRAAEVVCWPFKFLTMRCNISQITLMTMEEVIRTTELQSALDKLDVKYTKGSPPAR